MTDTPKPLPQVGDRVRVTTVREGTVTAVNGGYSLHVDHLYYTFEPSTPGATRTIEVIERPLPTKKNTVIACMSKDDRLMRENVVLTCDPCGRWVTVFGTTLTAEQVQRDFRWRVVYEPGR